MEIIENVRIMKSEIIWEGTLQPGKNLDKDKNYIAVIDINAVWFFNEHFSGENNIIGSFILKDPTEKNKTISTVQEILNFLFQKNVDRSYILIAIGGGITLDIAGFAASIYKRGIDWIAIPTTLLSQVDASVGGKTAINSITGKNTIGSFHPPVKVLITFLVSQSWKDWHYLDGIAEMFKIFKMFDHKAAIDLVNDPKNDYLTHRSIKIKAAVVRVDPWEKHLRASLNYGHTLGHALEFLMPIRHGMAVAFGMRCENYIAEKIGMMSKDTRKKMDLELAKIGLNIPKEMPTFKKLAPYILQDKKNIAGEIKLVLIDGINEFAITEHDPRKTISLDVIEKAYNSFCRENNIKRVLKCK